MKGFFRSIALLTLALVALTPARAQQTAAPAPQAQAEEKVNLYLISHVQEGDTVGQAFVDAFSKTLAGYKDLNIITTEPISTESPAATLTATQFRLLTVKTGDGNAVVAITVLRVTKGFVNATYVGTVLATTNATEAAEKAAEYVDFLGNVFANIEQSGEFDQGTPAAKQ